MARHLSKSQFAAELGVKPSYVTKLFQQGRLVMSSCGKFVDVDASRQRIEDTKDPSKRGVADRHERERIQRDVYVPMSSGEYDEPPAGRQPAAGGSGGPDFHQARAERETSLAALAKIELDKALKSTVEREPVVRAAHAAGRLVRDSIFTLNRQMAAELATMGDAWAIERYLNDKHRGMLTEVGRIAQDDLTRMIETE